MKKIKIKKIKDKSAYLYRINQNGKRDQRIGKISNILQFLDIRIQVMKNKIDNYYFLFKDSRNISHKIFILNDGKINERPKEFFDKVDDMLTVLIFPEK